MHVQTFYSVLEYLCAVVIFSECNDCSSHLEKSRQKVVQAINSTVHTDVFSGIKEEQQTAIK